MRTSAAIASFLVANTGLRSSSTISWKSVTSCETLTMMGLDAVEHRQRVLLGRRREPEGDVLENLDQHAAEAERDQLAERAIGDRADDDLGAAQQHLLDLDALDLGVSLVFLGVRQNGRVVLFDVGGGFHAHHHAARFGLVQDVRRDDLHHHREAHAGRDPGGFIGGFGHPLLGNRNAVGIAYQFAFRRRQAGALVRPDRIKNLADRIFRIRHWLPP
jgi:hypothetical protein